MAQDFQISRDSQALFITLTTHHRLPIFKRNEMNLVLCSALDEVRRSHNLLLFAYVIMIDHLHLLTNEPKPPSEVLRLVKGITAHRVIEYLKEKNHLNSLAKLRHQVRNRNYQHSLWQREKNLLPIFSEGMFMQKVNYIHNNPVKEGWVERAVDYPWSSARIWRACPNEDEPLLMDIDQIRWRK